MPLRQADDQVQSTHDGQILQKHHRLGLIAKFGVENECGWNQKHDQQPRPNTLLR